MSVRKRFYQGAQLQVRAWRLAVAKLEDNSRFDRELLEELTKARVALEMAEHIAAMRTAEWAA